MFIHPENQTILWDLMNEVSLFFNQPLEEREHQFRLAIEKIYHENQEKAKEKKHLIELNKQTIQLLLKMFSYENNKNIVSPTTNIITQPYQSQPYQSYDSNKREQSSNSFIENQQKEYYQNPIVEEPTEKKNSRTIPK